MKFEENLAEIDEIIERLESGDLSLHFSYLLTSFSHGSYPFI